MYFYGSVEIVPTRSLKDLLILQHLLLHASENPSSILCVVSGHICTYCYHNPFSGIVYSIMSNKTLPYHIEWNRLDKRTRRISNPSTFKSEIKTILFQNYFVV